jgi:hypothetical protein
MGHIWPFLNEYQTKSYHLGRMEKKNHKLNSTQSQAWPKLIVNTIELHVVTNIVVTKPHISSRVGVERWRWVQS